MKRSTPVRSFAAALLLVGIVAFEIVVGAKVPGSSAKPERGPASAAAAAVARIPATDLAGCDDANASIDLASAGYISYESVDSENCEGKGQSEVCSRQIQRDKDYCEDEHTVVKVSCATRAPSSAARPCPQGTTCRAGACK